MAVSRHVGQDSDSSGEKSKHVVLNIEMKVGLIHRLERGEWFREREREGICSTRRFICEKTFISNKKKAHQGALHFFWRMGEIFQGATWHSKKSTYCTWKKKTQPIPTSSSVLLTYFRALWELNLNYRTTIISRGTKKPSLMVEYNSRIYRDGSRVSGIFSFSISKSKVQLNRIFCPFEFVQVPAASGK